MIFIYGLPPGAFYCVIYPLIEISESGFHIDEPTNGFELVEWYP
jgi:hypothetical protein